MRARSLALSAVTLLLIACGSSSSDDAGVDGSGDDASSKSDATTTDAPSSSDSASDVTTPTDSSTSNDAASDAAGKCTILSCKSPNDCGGPSCGPCVQGLCAGYNP